MKSYLLFHDLVLMNMDEKMKINIAVCDDDPLMRSKIVKLIKSIRLDFNIYEYASGEELLASKNEFMIIFLDIEMPGINGLETAMHIRENDDKAIVIFLTSYDNYMQDAFKVKTFRYLEKPIVIDKFKEAFLAAVSEIETRKSVVINVQKGTRIIDYNDIICLEAFGDGIYIYTKNEIICSFVALKDMLNKLDEKDFFRVHKSFAVALKYVVSIDKNEVIMRYLKRAVPISRRNVTTFKKAYFEYVETNAMYV